MLTELRVGEMSEARGMHREYEKCVQIVISKTDMKRPCGLYGKHERGWKDLVNNYSTCFYSSRMRGCLDSGQPW